MAVTNRDRVGNAMDALKTGLAPFVSREFINHHKGRSDQVLQQVLGEPVHDAKGHFSGMDTAALLRLMWESWNEVYRDTLGHAERSPSERAAGYPQSLGAPRVFFQRRCLPGS